VRVFLGGEEGLCVIFLNKLEGEESGMVGLNHKTFNPNPLLCWLQFCWFKVRWKEMLSF